MSSLDPQLSSFAREAEQALGGKVEIATLKVDDKGWVRRLATLVEPAGTPTWTVRLEPEGESIDATNWHGLLDLWPETSHRVLIRRFPYLSQFGETLHLTLVAGRKREDLERAILYGRSLWRDWRRNKARVRDASGGDVAVTPVSWDQLCLPEALLDEIRNNVLHFASARDLYTTMGLPYRRGLLFYGAPGNGKTMTCRAIVTALGWPVVYVSPNSRDDTADEIRSAFSNAKDLAPCVLWFDDLDSLFETDATMSSFLNRLDGATTIPGMLVLATTNRPERLDPAIVARPSRFDRIFELGPPAAPERHRFFACRFGDRLDPTAREELVQRGSGMSMAFIQEVFVGAALRAVQRGELPNEADAFTVLEALMRHVRAADREFQAVAPTGFARLRDQ